MSKNMKPESASALFAPLKEALGMTPTYEFTFHLQRLAEGLATFLEPVKTTTTMEEFMAAMPEPPADELPTVVAIVGLLPFMVRDFMVQGGQTAKRQLPPDKQGRPKALNTDQRQRIVAKIGMLHTQGVTLGRAMHRASNEFGVSIATVRRAWSKRSSIPDKPAMTVQDAWREIVMSFMVDASATPDLPQ